LGLSFTLSCGVVGWLGGLELWTKVSWEGMVDQGEELGETAYGTEELYRIIEIHSLLRKLRLQPDLFYYCTRVNVPSLLLQIGVVAAAV